MRELEMLDAVREQAFDRLTLLATWALEVPMASVNLVDGDRQFLARSVGIPPDVDPEPETLLEGPYGRHVVDRAARLIIDDTRLGPLAGGASPLAGTLAYAGMPLLTSSGHVLGTLSVMDTAPRRWSGRDLGFLEALAASVMSEIELHAARLREHRRGERLEGLASDRHASLERANRFLAAAGEDLARSREETILRLAGAITARSGETGAHSNRMSTICAVLSYRVGLDADRAELIRIASPLHDVGKLAIPDVILNKPGPLSPAERTVIETHAEIGHRMLEGSGEPLLELAALMALTHHEWVDGSGYPGGMTGGDIPIEGRIAAVADVFDALTNARVYRPAFRIGEAMEMMDAGRGTQFDPIVFDALRDGLDPILAAVNEAGP